MGNKVSADLKYKHISNSSNDYIQVTDGLCPICYKKFTKYVYDNIIGKIICNKCFKRTSKLYKKNGVVTRDDFIKNILYSKDICFICMKKYKYLITEVFNINLKICYKCYKITYDIRMNDIENIKIKNLGIVKLE